MKQLIFLFILTSLSSCLPKLGEKGRLVFDPNKSDKNKPVSHPNIDPSFYYVDSSYETDEFKLFKKAIFQDNNCTSCHSAGSLNFLNLQAEDDWLNSRFVTPGVSEKSTIYTWLKSVEIQSDHRTVIPMPPVGSAPASIDKIKAWIDHYKPTDGQILVNMNFENFALNWTRSISQIGSMEISSDGADGSTKSLIFKPNSLGKTKKAFQFYFPVFPERRYRLKFSVRANRILNMNINFAQNNNQVILVSKSYQLESNWKNHEIDLETTNFTYVKGATNLRLDISFPGINESDSIGLDEITLTDI